MFGVFFLSAGTVFALLHEKLDEKVKAGWFCIAGAVTVLYILFALIF